MSQGLSITVLIDTGLTVGKIATQSLPNARQLRQGLLHIRQRRIRHCFNCLKYLVA